MWPTNNFGAACNVPLFINLESSILCSLYKNTMILLER